jgi:hypothetical protein
MEDLLEQREKLERRLHDEFRKEVTILFTDICGYTEYVKMRWLGKDKLPRNQPEVAGTDLEALLSVKREIIPVQLDLGVVRALPLFSRERRG